MSIDELIDELKKIEIDYNDTTVEQFLDMIPFSWNISRVIDKDNTLNANTYMLETKKLCGSYWKELDILFGNDIKELSAKMFLYYKMKKITNKVIL